jgi:hypothetical protein
MVRTYGIDVAAFLEREDVRIVARSGAELRGHCPLHDDRHPSFSMNTRTAQFICFVCGGGNVITLVEQIHGLSRAQARDYLVAHHGASLGRRPEPDPENPFSPAARRRRGQVVTGRKPGSTVHAAMLRKRAVQEAALGQTRVDLRRWIEAEFSLGKRHANNLIRSMIEERRLSVFAGRVFGSEIDARDVRPSPPVLSYRKQIAHPAKRAREIAHPVERAHGLIAHPAPDTLAYMARLIHVRSLRESIESDRDGLRAGRFTSERDVRVICARNADRARDLERVLARHIDELRAQVPSHA